MKIYISSHSRKLGNKIAELIVQRTGHKINARWLDMPYTPTSSMTHVDKQQAADVDLSDIYSSDILILVSGKDKYSGGKFVEAGFAIGLNKQVIILGQRENVLLYAPGTLLFEEFEDMLLFLKGLQ